MAHDYSAECARMGLEGSLNDDVGTTTDSASLGDVRNSISLSWNSLHGSPMPYQTYIFGGIKEPSDGTARLWRYMDLAQLLAILDRQELFFPSIATLAESDPYEGEPILSKIEAARAKGSEELRRLRLQVEVFKRLNFFNCWHMNDSESDAMWKLYAKGSAGVAIRSIVCHVMGSFDKASDTVYMSEMRYADPDKLTAPHASRFGVSDYIFKRSAFQHEKEVRLGTHRSDVREEFVDDQGILKIPELGVTADQILKSPARKGVYVAVDVATLVDAVVVSPYAPNWFSDLVSSLTRKLGYEFEIVSSEMSRPFAL